MASQVIDSSEEFLAVPLGLKKVQTSCKLGRGSLELPGISFAEQLRAPDLLYGVTDTYNAAKRKRRLSSFPMSLDQLANMSGTFNSKEKLTKSREDMLSCGSEDSFEENENDLIDCLPAEL